MYSHVLIYNPHGEEYKEYLNIRVIQDHKAKISWASNKEEGLDVLEKEKDIDLVLICSELTLKSSLPMKDVIANPMDFLRAIKQKELNREYKGDKFYLCPNYHRAIIDKVRRGGFGSLKAIENMFAKNLMFP